MIDIAIIENKLEPYLVNRFFKRLYPLGSSGVKTSFQVNSPQVFY